MTTRVGSTNKFGLYTFQAQNRAKTVAAGKVKNWFIVHGECERNLTCIFKTAHQAGDIFPFGTRWKKMGECGEMSHQNTLFSLCTKFGHGNWDMSD